MKKKLVGILVSMIMIATCFTVAQSTNNEPLERNINEAAPPMTTSSNDTVPVWAVGDSWTYAMNNINVDINQGNLSFHLHFESNELPFQVVEVTDDSYVLNFTASIGGYGTIYADLGNDHRINISATINQAKIQGLLWYTKSDIALQKIQTVLSGNFSGEITEILFPLHRPIPAQMNFTMNTTAEVEAPYPTLLQFPLNEGETGKLWKRPATNVTITGEFFSQNLKKIYDVYHRGLTQILIKIIHPLLPPKLRGAFDNLLDLFDLIQPQDPYGVIRIEDVFNFPWLLGTHRFPLPEGVLWQNNMTTITVPAGTFHCYNITAMDGLMHVYYNTTVGNYVKLSGPAINVELLSWHRTSPG
jgi:hypothetical protein